VYFFYDHTGAIGKAFACIDLLRAPAHTTGRECRSNFTPFVQGPNLSRESNGIEGRAPHGGLAPSHANRLHFHDTAAARDNGNERRSRDIDVHNRHRYRSRRGGA
jgi:hypothetical protein